MAAKKAKGPKKAAGAGKESDEDFLKRLARMKEDASRKASEELNPYSKETEEFRAKGREVGKDLEEHEECKKIQKEFETSPPIAISTHIDGKSVEYRYEEKFQKKIDLLKKHGFPFLCAAHSSNVLVIPFRVTVGKAYIKRGSRKIPLPPSSSDLPFALKDGDILCTERDSVAEVSDLPHGDEQSYNATLYPDSEMRLTITEKETHPEPAFMEPSKVPEAIKKNSTSTLLTPSLRCMEPLKGLISINIWKPGQDANRFIRIPERYPQIEFGSFGKLGAHMLEDTISKIASQRPELKALMERQYRPHITKGQSKICDAIHAFIDLNADGTMVIVGSSNAIIHRASGKVTKKVGLMKVTVTPGAIYETDCMKNPDPRVSALTSADYLSGLSYHTIAKEKATLEAQLAGKSPEIERAKELVRYAEGLGDKSLLILAKNALAEQEAELKRQASVHTPERREAAKAEAEQMLKAAEDIGDESLIEVAKAQVNAALGDDVKHIIAQLRESLKETEKEGDKLHIEIAKAQLSAAQNASSKGVDAVITAINLVTASATIPYLDQALKELEPKAKKTPPPFNPPTESDRVS